MIVEDEQTIRDMVGETLGKWGFETETNVFALLWIKSTGMGLYLAKQIALKLGHDLSIEYHRLQYFN